MIGAAATHQTPVSWVNMIILGLYFTFPANFLLYGVNDLFDYETDKHNPKKQHYELLLKPADQRRLIKAIWLWNVPLLTGWLISAIPTPARWGLIGFVFFGVFYSAPPIRAKAKPLIDSFFNILYIFPAIISYGLLTSQYPPMMLLVAAALWCMAMHAYSAVPDIAADKKAGLSTIATRLGQRNTLLFCLAGFIISAAVAFNSLGTFSIAAGLIYAGMVVASLVNPNRNHVLKLYKWFPLINMVVGAALFFWVKFT